MSILNIVNARLILAAMSAGYMPNPRFIKGIESKVVSCLLKPGKRVASFHHA